MISAATSPNGGRFRLMIALALIGIPCQAAEIRIEGLSRMKEADALKLLGDRLEYIRRKAPSRARADDAAFLLSTLMERQGYQQARITPTIAGQTIILRVDEGPRLSLGSLALPGVPADDQIRLAKLFRLPGQERGIGPAQESPFREADLAEGLALIEADFRSRSFWKASATVEKRTLDPSSNRIDFVIRVDPGPPHRLGAPRFDGAPDALLPVLVARAAPHVGKAAVTERLSTLRGEIEDIFRSAGYPLESFKMNRILDVGILTPRFIIRCGPRQKLGNVRAIGLGKTREQRVTTRFESLRGKWFDARSFDSRIAQLLATGAFSSIRVEKHSASDGSVDATLRLIEGPARGATSYAGFGSYEGAIFGVKYHDRNYLGELWNLSTGVEFSSRGALGELRLSNPWLLDTDTRLGLRLFAVTRDHEGYGKFESGLSAELSRDALGGWLDTDLLFGSSLVNIADEGIPLRELGETVYTHHFLRGSVGIDRRDSPIAPTRGHHLNALLEAGLILGDLDSNYLRLDTSFATYQPHGSHGQFNFGARAGVLFPSGGPSDFPIDLRLFNGGPDSVRSFRYRELGPRTSNNDPAGGEAYWVANAEYIRQLSGPLKAVAFLDAGELSPLGKGFDFANPEIAVGFGTRLSLPIGLIRLEYGHNLTRDQAESSGTWHFAIGSAF